MFYDPSVLLRNWIAGRQVTAHGVECGGFLLRILGHSHGNLVDADVGPIDADAYLPSCK
jgi:hypothetical protein